MQTIYDNNDVEIVIERIDQYESRVNVIGEGNLIVISNDDRNDFIRELRNLLDKYRI